MYFNKKSLKRGAACTAALFGISAAPAAVSTTAYASPSSAPNILFILVDDLGYGDISLNNSNSVVQTPNINSIAQNGINFTNAYSTSPVCSPSRSGLIIGRTPATYGFDSNEATRLTYEGNGENLPVSMGQYMKSQNYNTAVFGKWDLGSKMNVNDPFSKGFDYFYGFLGGMNSFYPATGNSECVHLSASNNYTVLHGGEIKVNSGRNIKEMSNGNYTDVSPNEHLTDIFTTKAVNYINQNSNKDKPFFMYLSYNAPHSPYQAPESYYNKFDTIQDGKQRIYAAMINQLDDGIGNVLQALRDNNVYDNTIVVFSSDNGGVVGVANNLGYRGGKWEVFQGGVRVPFAMQWPGNTQISKGSAYSEVISHLDLFPTFAAQAGGLNDAQLAAMNLEGRNLLNYVTNQNEPPLHNYLAWRYISDKSTGDIYSDDLEYGIVKNNYKYVYIQSPQKGRTDEYLFDLNTAPGEDDTANLFNNTDYSEQLADIKATLSEWDEEKPSLPDNRIKFYDAMSLTPAQGVPYWNITSVDTESGTQKSRDTNDELFTDEAIGNPSSDNLFDNSSVQTGVGVSATVANKWALGASRNPGNVSLAHDTDISYSANDSYDASSGVFSDVYKISNVNGSSLGSQQSLYYYTQVPQITEPDGQDFVLTVWMRHINENSGFPTSGETNNALTIAFSKDALPKTSFQFNPINTNYATVWQNYLGISGILSGFTATGSNAPGKWKRYQSVIHIPKSASEENYNMLFSVGLQGMSPGSPGGEFLYIADPSILPLAKPDITIESNRTSVSSGDNTNTVDFTATINKADSVIESWGVYSDVDCTIPAGNGISIAALANNTAQLSFDFDNPNLANECTVYVKATLSNEGSASNVVTIHYIGLPELSISGIPANIVVNPGQYLSFPLTASANYSAEFEWSLSGAPNGVSLSGNSGTDVKLIIDNRNSDITSGNFSIGLNGSGDVSLAPVSVPLTAVNDTVTDVPIIRFADKGSATDAPVLSPDSIPVSGLASGANMLVPMTFGTVANSAMANGYAADEWRTHVTASAGSAGEYTTVSDAPVNGASVIKVSNSSASDTTNTIGGNGGYIYQRKTISVPSEGAYYYASGWIKYADGNLKDTAGSDSVLCFGIYDVLKSVGTPANANAYFEVPLSSIVDTDTVGGSWQRYEYVFWIPGEFNGKFFDVRTYSASAGNYLQGPFEWYFSDMRMTPFAPNNIELISITDNNDDTVTVNMTTPLGNNALFVSAYSGSKLLAVRCITQESAENAGIDITDTTLNISFSDDISTADRIQAMICSDVDSLRPLCPIKFNN